MKKLQNNGKNKVSKSINNKSKILSIEPSQDQSKLPSSKELIKTNHYGLVESQKSIKSSTSNSIKMCSKILVTPCLTFTSQPKDKLNLLA